MVHWRYDYQVQQYVAVLTPFFALLFIFVVNPVVGGSLLITLPLIPLFMILVGKGAAALMQPGPVGQLQMHRVAPQVNSNRAAGPELIEPFYEDAEQEPAQPQDADFPAQLSHETEPRLI